MVTEWGAAATVRGRKTEVAMIELDGPRLDPADGGAAKALVVMLHGVGADGNDLIGIAPLWAQLLPGVAFVSPNAPEPCDMAPFGHQWFSLQDRRPAAMLAGVQDRKSTRLHSSH